MRAIPKPAIDIEEHFRNCAQGTYDQDLKARLLDSSSIIVAAASAYDAAGASGRFFELVKSSGAAATDDELRDMYKRTMLPNKARGRHVYDLLRHGAPNGICPFCSQRTVSTLDHYLPKTRFPDLSILPLNLVPACPDCNNKKLEHAPRSEAEQLIHPYYDRLPDGQWLLASVRYSSGIPVVLFAAEPPDDWEASLRMRVKLQFKQLGLASLYASHAAEEIANIRHSLGVLLQAGGVSAVQSRLAEQAASRMSVNPNSWQTAMYEAISNSPEFCSGNFGGSQNSSGALA